MRKIHRNFIGLAMLIFVLTNASAQWNDSQSGKLTTFDKVGIGTASPTNKLHLSGLNNDGINFDNKFRMRTSSTTNTFVMEHIANTGNIVFRSMEAGDASGNLVINDLGGNVGIGTNAPSSKLDVAGSIKSKDEFELSSSGGQSTGMKLKDYYSNKDYEIKRHFYQQTGGGHMRIGRSGTGSNEHGPNAPQALYFDQDRIRFGFGVPSSSGADFQLDGSISSLGKAEFNGEIGVSYMPGSQNYTSVSRLNLEGASDYKLENQGDPGNGAFFIGRSVHPSHASYAEGSLIFKNGKVRLGSSRPEDNGADFQLDGSMSSLGQAEFTGEIGVSYMPGSQNYTNVSRLNLEGPSDYKLENQADLGGGAFFIGKSTHPSHASYAAGSLIFKDEKVRLGSSRPEPNGADFQLDGSMSVNLSGAVPSGIEFAVGGDILAESVKVELQSNWPDYVFSNDYVLTPLADVKRYIEENNHLPNIPSAEEMKEKKLDLGEMNAKLLEKIEELTLHMIEMSEELTAQKKSIDMLLVENHSLKETKTK